MPHPADRPELSRRTLEAVRERDPQALADLFERSFERLYSLAYRMLGDRSAAEDVTQEVYLKVHQAAPQIDTERDPGPWLTTITVNACREHWRRKGRKVDRGSRSINGDDALKATLTNGRRNPERETLKRERERAVMAALKKLSEPLRTVVILHDYEGLTHEEIAGMLGKSPAAVRKRHSRALSRLRPLLEEVLA